MPSSRSNSKPPAKAQTVQYEWSFEAIGTQWWIGLYEPIEPSKLQRLERAVADRIETYDKIYSRFRADSLISRISRSAGSYEFPADSKPLFDIYRQLYDFTDGLVTPLIGGSLADAGYDADYSLRPGPIRQVSAWEAVMRFEDNTLQTKQPLLLDFGAAGKGYLIDIIAELLRSNGINTFCIDGSGDLVCFGLEQPLRIGLEHPDDSSQAIGVAEVSSGAICGSASNRRTWAGYNHILNPRTLTSETDIKATWVTAMSGLEADGLATALFFVSPEILENRFGFNWLVVYADNSMKRSPDFPATMFGADV